jgi:hypothetical protein
MTPNKIYPLDELLQMPCNEEIFDRILEILDRKQLADSKVLKDGAHLLPS